jgi:hypothetical protein
MAKILFLDESGDHNLAIIDPQYPLFVVEGVLCLLDENGVLVVPLSLDYLQWTESVSTVAERFADPKERGQEIKGLILWTDGQLSARAQTELTQRQIGVEASVKIAEY